MKSTRAKARLSRRVRRKQGILKAKKQEES
jgi:hypothetical protein